MSTECKTESVQFHALGSREVRGQFDGGDISSDGGGLLLREVEKRTGILGTLLHGSSRRMSYHCVFQHRG